MLLGENWCWSLLGPKGLSKDVFELRTSTGSDTIFHLTCLNATKIVLLSVLSLVKKIAEKLGTTTAQGCKKPTSGPRALLKNVFA